MQVIALILSRLQLGKWSLLLGLAVSSCQTSTVPPKRVINIHQEWELEPGDLIGEHLVVGSLGDISIQLKRQPLRAPFLGELEPSTIEQCVIYSTPEVPAYLFRFCGLRRPRFGRVDAGQIIGNGNYIQFATLRRQPDGTWIIVEPSTGILERAISDRYSADKKATERSNHDKVESPNPSAGDKSDS